MRPGREGEIGGAAEETETPRPRHRPGSVPSHGALGNERRRVCLDDAGDLRAEREAGVYQRRN